MPWLSNHGIFVFIYVHIYHKYIYIYTSYLYTLYIHHIHIIFISFHFISYHIIYIYIYIISIIYIYIYSLASCPNQKKTSNLNFQHVPTVLSSSSLESQAKQLLSESLLCPTSGFPPTKVKNTILGKEKTPWFPQKPVETWKSTRKIQQNPPNSQLALSFVLSNTFQVNTATAEEKKTLHIEKNIQEFQLAFKQNQEPGFPPFFVGGGPQIIIFSFATKTLGKAKG